MCNILRFKQDSVDVIFIERRGIGKVACENGNEIIPSEENFVS